MPNLPWRIARYCPPNNRASTRLSCDCKFLLTTVRPNPWIVQATQGLDYSASSANTPFEILGGDGGVLGVVLFEFPSMEEARSWYTGPAYQEVKKRREGAAKFDLILVEGGVGPAAQRMPKSSS